MRLAMLAALLALLATLAASCGDGGDGGDRLSYPRLQQRAGAVCLRYHRALARLGPPTTLPRIAKVARGADSLGRSERRQLAQLQPPKDADDAYARMIEGFRRADALLPSVRRAAAAKQVGVTRKLIRRGRAAVMAANRDAVAIGLSGCLRS
jgi:hypothetical protein